MKKIKIILIILIYIGLMFINTKVLAANTKGTTKNDTTRIREEASTDSNTVTLVPNGKEVEITATEGEWYKVSYTDEGLTYVGYIRKDMLTVEGEAQETETTSNKEDVVEQKNTEENKQDENSEKSSSKIQIRILPLINSQTIAEINNSQKITVTETIGNWSYIETSKKSGWVMTRQIENIEQEEEQTTNTENETSVEENQNNEEKEEETKKEETQETKIKYVSTETLNLREEAKTDAPIVQQLALNTIVTVIEEVDDTWSKVQVGGNTGYIASKYLSDKKTEVTSRGATEAREDKNKTEETEQKEEEAKSATKTENNNTQKEENKTETKKETATSKKSSGVTGADIVSYAKKYVGYNYVSGGASPSTGFDCSGLTYYIYKQNGYTISRTSGAQASNGKKVSKSNLKAGDLVIFNNSSNTSVGHVGIYIGGNQFIHAANSRKGVITTSLSDSYYSKRFVSGRRIIN